MITNVKDIDIEFDFTTDTLDYWSGNGADPDSSSPTMQRYQKLLWSKKLPNGEIMNLEEGYGPTYLSWKHFRFGSDSIINMYSHHRNLYMQNLIEEVKSTADNYDELIETYIRKGYSIGGEIIFPKKGSKYSINPSRGTNTLIRDRFDLTLECIRRYYNSENSPLIEALEHNKEFFDLFEDFKGYVNFFYLQDLVSKDYLKINFFLNCDDFKRDPYPKNVNEWFTLYDKQMTFLKERNTRIFNYLRSL